MHIPDNYLSPETCLVLGAAMVPVLAVSVRRVRAKLPERNVPLIGVGAALSFLIMFFNVPVPGGTTAHAVGGTLLAVLLGPEAACLALAAALLIQSLFFGDGGILALGANLFNIAFVMPFSGYALYHAFASVLTGGKRKLAAAGIASYAAINLGALAAGVEFGIQPLLFRGPDGLPLYSPYPLQISVPAMLIPHLTVAGFAEAAFTVGVLAFLHRVSPDMLQSGEVSYKKWSGLLLFLVMLTPLGLLAAATAWGEWSGREIGRQIGYVPSGMTHGVDYHALFSGYSMNGLPPFAGYLLSAVAGCAILIILFRLLQSGRRKGGQR
ncbi:cobalt transporter CbiM [Sporolactobacillus vineae]|uniref:cobalt transporter CbiM n=1 Tax=Sporolactobacillus vineae TaxID=444463 RepID=UPI000288D58D|nr:cobalt transporter CbiM [Sporolactobacillus vineae]